jgi:hypothetical protein
MDDAIRRLHAEARRSAQGKAPTAIRYSAAFRAATVAAVRAELRRGAPLGRLAHELGLPRWSLARWLRQRPARALRPVTVAPDPGPMPQAEAGAVLIMPQGIRVEGLAPETLIVVLRALG